MYIIESFDGRGVLIVNDSIDYRSTFNAGSLGDAESIVVGLNRTLLLSDLALYRLNFETAGIVTEGGLSIRTDRESQAQLNAAYTTLKNGLIPDTDWKGSVDWEAVNLNQIEPIAKLVAAHVRACFRGERLTQEAIATAETVADIDAIDIVNLFGAAYTTALTEVMQPAGA